jgi:hypothetical protein
MLPSSMGGTDEEDNLVSLTHREHMLAHTLLAHVFGNQWFSVELLGLRTLKKLPRWKRKAIAYRRAELQREARRKARNLPKSGESTTNTAELT